jgi:hypothetical protein
MPSALDVLPFVPVAAEAPPAPAASARFTLDGDAGLEAHLAGVCEQVRAGIERLVPRARLEGILLGGGYGRGEGGVLSGPDGDRPYNDLEFYVLLRGNTVLNERRHRAALDHLAHELSVPAGIEVEFKIISSATLRRSAVTMFYYDLVSGHRRIMGAASVLDGCAHQGRSADIPVAEATRLLLNRSSGLLFARQRLDREPFTADDADFVERNLAKAQLALGDVVLVAFRQYHWSCRERGRRLSLLTFHPGLAWLDAVKREHEAGLEFKLRPHRTGRGAAQLEPDFARVSQLACRVWLWLESRRLRADFDSPAGYALHAAAKCPEMPALRNWLVSARRFRDGELFTARAFRYPRERLLRALPVLLWEPELIGDSRVRLCLQRELRTSAVDRPGLTAAYTRLWEIFR